MTIMMLMMLMMIMMLMLMMLMMIMMLMMVICSDGKKDCYIIYYWLGSHSSQDEQV